MDDSCAVCAEILEWVGYGSCGHREVCSTCVIRLRFVCDDRRCCICKTESNVIFITKALGDYTRVINDFSVFPTNAKEGRVGEYWYHEGTQAYFDDLGHYKMIKAMCRLSCSVCDNKIDEQRSERPKRQEEYTNIDQLNNHLLHRHRLLMCSLCLEGRKIFICEHKLYSRSQLNQHMKAGDSEVDGSESERGGFSGHPFCEFCRDPFYGDNELYTHMSTEHFTCHICQRQNPGKYVYYKNYDDLEIHFRQLHFLCEDESCLAKKFIVFINESEMKRHNALEHGGNMSRAKRNANLQIPTSFQYRRDNEQNRRGRRNFHPDSSDFQLSLAIQASLETNTSTRPRVTSSTVAASSSHPERNAIDSIVNPFELLSTSDSGTSASTHQSLNLGNGRLAESFPPLPMASGSSRHHSKTESGNTMAARLRSRNSVNILNKARPRSTFGPTLPSVPPSHSQQKSVSVGNGEHVGSSYAVSTSTVSATAYGHVSSNSASSSSNLSAMSKVGLSASALNHGGTGNSISNFPPISSVQTNRSADVQAANKSLIEKIRAALEFDEEKFKAFKEVSTKFRKGVSDASEYLASVQQFGLSHLVVELASLCPDVEKQKDLLETYNYNVRGCFNGNSPSIDSGQSKNKKGKRKGKEKCEGIGVNLVKDDLAVNSKLSCGEEPDVLSIKGKSKVLVNNEQIERNPLQRESSNQNGSLSAVGSSKQVLVSGGAGNKQRKKSSKFLRARLGETSAVASFSDAGHSEPSSVPCEAKTNGNKGISNGLPVGGVWGNGGGRKLVAMTKRGTPK